MKKLQEIIKPFLSLILGALMLLYYLNWLSLNGGGLALGIIAIIMAAYYLAVGVLSVIAKEKISASLKKILDVVSIVFLPLFIFVYFLIILITNGGALGPNGWIISIFGIVVSLAVVIIQLLDTFAKDVNVGKFSQLFGMAFILVLLLIILFDAGGDPIVLGAIDIILLVIYLVYSLMLFDIIGKKEVTSKKE